jgi:hypothetical protein
MFGLKLKRRKKAHVFTQIDRELADTIRHRKQMRQLERLRAIDAGKEDNVKASLSEQLAELREVGEQMGWFKDQDAGSDSEMLDLIKTFMQSYAGKSSIPQDIAIVGKNADATDQIIANLPQNIIDGIQSGKIPKAMAEKYAIHYAKNQFSKIWKRLRSGKTNR